MSRIHSTAIIDPNACLDEDVEVGPYAVIEADTVIGSGCVIGAHAVVKRYTRMGKRNRVSEHATIGGEPQDVSFRPCKSYVTIGEDNILREGVTVHRATKPGKSTSIGDSNFLMAYAHIAHECVVKDHTVFANGSALAGYVQVGDHAFLSGYVSVHQFCRIGCYAMVSGLSGVNQDCLPFVISAGIPARALGINIVGLRRAGFSASTVKELKRAYQVLLRSGKPLETALSELADSKSAQVQQLVEFVQSSARGFAHGA